MTSLEYTSRAASGDHAGWLRSFDRFPPGIRRQFVLLGAVDSPEQGNENMCSERREVDANGTLFIVSTYITPRKAGTNCI